MEEATQDITTKLGSEQPKISDQLVYDVTPACMRLVPSLAGLPWPHRYSVVRHALGEILGMAVSKLSYNDWRCCLSRGVIRAARQICTDG